LLAGPLDRPADPLLMRLTLLVLMSVCAYGVAGALRTPAQGGRGGPRVCHARRPIARRRPAGRRVRPSSQKSLAIINNACFSLQRAHKQGRPPPPDQIGIIQEEAEHADRIITQIMGYAQLSEAAWKS